MTIWYGYAAFAVFTGLTIAAVFQVVPCLRRIKRVAVDRHHSGEWPRAQVILSLKGLDPFLERCLDRLATQDYPNYQITVVVDSADDPAWDFAEAAQRSYGRGLITLQARRHFHGTCTRKLNNILTGVETLPEEVEVVALCDGDAIVHSTWLRELVQGLNGESCGAVSGTRWYSPTEFGISTLSRHYWNALAIPMQRQYGILWGGSLAVRRSVMDEPEFRELFSRGFSDDATIAQYLHETGRHYEVLGATYVVNSETVNCGAYWNFLVRQMLCVRMNHPRWRPVLWHAVALTLGLAWLVSAFVLSDLNGALIAFAGLNIYGLTLLYLTSAFDARLRKVYPEREALQVPVGWKRIAMALPALLFTAVIYPAATISAACLSQIRWRGVEYHLAGGRVASTADCIEARPSVAA